jgi:magnesium transporter
MNVSIDVDYPTTTKMAQRVCYTRHMTNRYEYGGVAWVDFESPSPSDIRTVVDEFDIDPVLANELTTPSVRSKAERVGDYIYVILHFPTLRHDAGATEIDFLIGKEHIVTAHYRSSDAMHEFRRNVETRTMLERTNTDSTGGLVFFSMMRDLYHALADELDVLSSILQDIETNVFKGKEREMVFEISDTNRKILHYSASLRHHKAVLESFGTHAVMLFGPEYRHYVDVMLGEYAKVSSTLEHMREYLAEIRATNDSLLTTKQNEIVKVLTIMAFNTVPLTLVASIFGMNSDNMPIIGHRYDFWIVVALMAGTALAMYLFFRHKRWI